MSVSTWRSPTVIPIFVDRFASRLAGLPPSSLSHYAHSLMNAAWSGR